MTKLLRSLSTFVVIVVAFMAFAITANAEKVVIDNTATHTVTEGTVYWERSTHWGSGKHNTVCEGNQYTDVISGTFPVWIDGYSIIDQTGHIVESFLAKKIQKLSIPSITNGQTLMLHVWGMDEGGHRLGWVESSKVSSTEDAPDYTFSATPEETDPNYTISEISEKEEKEWFESSNEKTVNKTADTLKKEIEADAEIPRESYILADFSGSMTGFQSDVLEKLEGTSGKKYVFAEQLEEFVSGKDTVEYSIGMGYTDIANALNKMKMSEMCNNAHIYILSDLGDNCGTKIEQNEDFIGEITIVYYPSLWVSATFFMEKLRDAYPNAIITGFYSSTNVQIGGITIKQMVLKKGTICYFNQILKQGYFIPLPRMVYQFTLKVLLACHLMQLAFK